MVSLNIEGKKIKTTIIFIITSLFALFCSLSAFAQTQQTFTSSGTFTVPAGVTSIVVECWGAGGGGSSITSNGVIGAGGGGGAYANKVISVTPGNTYNVVVGTGGAANSNGGNSFFNINSVVAEGGFGAIADANTNGIGGTLSGSIGTTIHIGGNGGLAGLILSGGGGGAAGSTGAGNSAINNIGGLSKSANGGAGGDGISGSNNGSNGSNYGAGGSGASTNDDVDRDGGSGANGLVVLSWSTANCQYSDNTYSGITFTPSVNMPTNQQTISSTFASNSYFLLNVIKGLNYQLYTCSSPSKPLKMSVYQQGLPLASVIATSTLNTLNTCNTHPNNVFLSFTSPISGQVRVLVNSMVDCSSTAITGLTLNSNVNSGANTQDDQTAAGSDSWIGHIYDGMTFNNYIGYYSQTETFKEGFGTAGTWPANSSDDATGFNVYSDGEIRSIIKDISFSVKYRMNSTKKGVYIADMTSDDGNRLYVDGNLVFSDWTNHGPKTWSKVLFPLTGASTLNFEYFENTGGNVVGLNNLVELFPNDLTTNTTQDLCIGYTGISIGGDVYGTLPAGISLSGTGYQWTYSTTPSGTRTNIAGATAETFTPNTLGAPFNVAGTYYIYRNSVLSSTNNVSPSPYICTQESNPATLVVNPFLPVSVSISPSANPVCAGTLVTFTATPTNGGSSPVYQWKVNGVNVGTNSPVYSYVPGADAVTCELTSNVTPCAITNPATSTTIMVMVDPNLPISVSIAVSDNPVCSGSNVTYTATPINGGSAPIYQWKVNGINVGTTSATFSYTPLDNDVVTTVLTSDASQCAIGSPATSNSVTMSVLTTFTIELNSGVGSNAQTLCQNNPISSINYTTTGATGANFSGLPAGVTGALVGNTVTISGTPTVSGTFNYTVTLTGAYYCVITATGSIVVAPLPSSPTSSGTNSICVGNTSTFVASGAVVGNKYVWYAASSGGTPLKTSTSNTDNNYVTPSLGATTSYWVSILNATGCESSRTQVTATFPASSPDDQSLAGTDTWIGHVYDGNNFNTYLGYFTQAETFNQVFGGNTNCFSITSSLGARSIYTETFSVKYRMNSTKRGLYVVDLGSDDGSRLTVNGNLIFNNWIAQSFSNRPSVLLSLTGSSSLIYEYYENGGNNQVVFQTFTKVLDNNLTTATTQSICIGAIGNSISGDAFGTLPVGITLSGTGYQWTYSTTLGGARTNITGATGATFTPNTSTSPFNVEGTYYVYRNAILSSTNNISPATYVATNESNASVITINTCVNRWVGSTDTDWAKISNWSANYVPTTGQNIEFATVANSGVAAQNDLRLDADRTIETLVNMSTKNLIIPALKALTVNSTITTDGNPNRIYIQSSSSAANGSLIFHNDANAPVAATVEMYTISSWNLSSAVVGSKYKWQYLSIPVRTIKANPTFYGGYIRRWNEPTSKWIQLTNDDYVNSFYGHEIVFPAAKTLVFSGELENRDLSINLNPALTGNFAGQYIFGNPYTAAIDITKLNFGSKTEAVVYLYSTGSSNDWLTSAASGVNPGQYLSIPKNLAGIGLPLQIPSMQGFLIKVLNTSESATFTIPYSSVVKNTTQQRARLQDGETKATPVYTVINIKGTRFADCLWIYSDPNCTNRYDNGWDGKKMFGSSLSPQLYAIGTDGEYQVNSVDDINETELGFNAGEDTDYSISFTHTNFESRYNSLYLMDLETQKTIDISQTGTVYSFSATPYASPIKRFRIITNPSITTDIPNAPSETSNKLRVFSSQKTVLVHNPSSFGGELTLTDMNGRIVQKSQLKADEISTINTQLPAGAYVAKVVAGNLVVIDNIILR